MLRVCGAEEERDNLSARQCWCHGLFCGRGGFHRSREFRRDFKAKLPAYTRVQFEELVRQQGLFDGNELRDKWIAKLEAHLPREQRGRRKAAAHG